MRDDAIFLNACEGSLLFELASSDSCNESCGISECLVQRSAVLSNLRSAQLGRAVLAVSQEGFKVWQNYTIGDILNLKELFDLLEVCTDLSNASDVMNVLKSIRVPGAASIPVRSRSFGSGQHPF
jgi:hypothetical protein